MAAGAGQRKGTEINFGDMMSLSAVVEVGGKKKTLCMRNLFELYVYSRLVLKYSYNGKGSASHYCVGLTARADILEYLNGNHVDKQSCKDLFGMLEFGKNQIDCIELFSAYLMPFFGDFVDWIVLEISYTVFDTSFNAMDVPPQETIMRDVICGALLIGGGHFVPFIILWKQKKFYYLDPMGAVDDLTQKNSQAIIKILKYMGKRRREVDDVSLQFKVIRLDFPDGEFKQPTGSNSCMVMSCVIFFTFLKYLRKQKINGSEELSFPISKDGKSYDLSEILEHKYIAKTGILSFQRGILMLILKTMEFEEAINFDHIISSSQPSRLPNKSQSELEDLQRTEFSDKYNHVDTVWKYVLVGDCGIPREIFEENAAMDITRNALHANSIFTTAKLAILMIVRHYKKEQEILMQVFNAIPESPNPKILKDHSKMTVYTIDLH